VLNKLPKTQTSVAKDSLMLTVDILLFSRVLLELNGLTLTINAATATLSGVLLTFGKIRPLKSLDSHGLETISLKVSVVLNLTTEKLSTAIEEFKQTNQR
jgi:hypothetical protein